MCNLLNLHDKIFAKKISCNRANGAFLKRIGEYMFKMNGTQDMFQDNIIIIIIIIIIIVIVMLLSLL
jgi:hypothetical protein